MLCVFEIIHNISQTSGSTVATPRAEINPFARLAEDKEALTPKLDTILCRRLLDQQRASLKKDVQPSSPLGSGMPRRAYELSVLLPRGKPLVEPVHLSAEEEAIRQPFVGVRLAREPTLPELSDFAESLRGKKVYLHASLSSLFARHLTSYLAAWGLDISHIPIEEDETSAPGARLDAGFSGSSLSTPADEAAAGIHNLTLGPKDTDKFIIVDDDVTVLRRELLKMCSDTSLLKPRLNKRPTLGSRARSTPAIRPAMATRTKTPVLIHFTSLANYNQVRDIIASVFGPQWSARDGAFYHPEVMVIPKPVGPRRFLTALHTAVNQPLVDPTFSPIATTPRSPGGGYFWTGGRTPLGNEGPRDGFFDSVAEEQGEGSSGGGSQKARSPMVEHPPSTSDNNLHPAADIVSTPATEYFSAATRSSSGASGIIVHSPDGRFGIHFEPPVRGERRSSYSQRAPAEPRRQSARGTPGAMPEPPSSSTSPSVSPQAARRQNGGSVTSETATPGTAVRRSSLREEAQSERRRKTLPAAGEPLVLQGRRRSSTITQRNKPGTPTTPAPLVTSPITTAPPLKKKPKEEVVVPPINVLIVEGK
jgi:osomolarity two-component system response regulator SSK1